MGRCQQERPLSGSAFARTLSRVRVPILRARSPNATNLRARIGCTAGLRSDSDAVPAVSVIDVHGSGK